jgi:hypothetical protein
LERQLASDFVPRELTDMASNVNPLAQGQVSDDPRFSERYGLVLGVGLNSGVYTGIGVPPNSLGNNDDLYICSDTPGRVNQRLYMKSAGAWVTTAA